MMYLDQRSGLDADCLRGQTGQMNGAWWLRAASIGVAALLMAAFLPMAQNAAAGGPVRVGPGDYGFSPPEEATHRGLLDLGRPDRRPVFAGPTSAIIAGRVNRTSLDLVASYDVRLRLSSDAGSLSGTSAMLVTNRSGGPIDRLELNTIMARLGHLRISSLTVDGVATGPIVRDQTLIVPLGGILQAGASARIEIAFAIRS